MCVLRPRVLRSHCYCTGPRSQTSACSLFVSQGKINILEPLALFFFNSLIPMILPTASRAAGRITRGIMLCQQVGRRCRCRRERRLPGPQRLGRNALVSKARTSAGRRTAAHRRSSVRRLPRTDRRDSAPRTDGPARERKNRSPPLCPSRFVRVRKSGRASGADHHGGRRASRLPVEVLCTVRLGRVTRAEIRVAFAPLRAQTAIRVAFAVKSELLSRPSGHRQLVPRALKGTGTAAQFGLNIISYYITSHYITLHYIICYYMLYLYRVALIWRTMRRSLPGEARAHAGHRAAGSALIRVNPRPSRCGIHWPKIIYIYIL